MEPSPHHSKYCCLPEKPSAAPRSHPSALGPAATDLRCAITLTFWRDRASWCHRMCNLSDCFLVASLPCTIDSTLPFLCIEGQGKGSVKYRLSLSGNRASDDTECMLPDHTRRSIPRVYHWQGCQVCSFGCSVDHLGFCKSRSFP